MLAGPKKRSSPNSVLRLLIRFFLNSMDRSRAILSHTQDRSRDVSERKQFNFCQRISSCLLTISELTLINILKRTINSVFALEICFHCNSAQRCFIAQHYRHICC